jgi:hypothetical protein
MESNLGHKCPLCSAAVFAQAAPHLRKSRGKPAAVCICYVVATVFCSVILGWLLPPVALIAAAVLLLFAFVHFCVFVLRLSQGMPSEWKCSMCQWHGLDATRK